MDWPSVFTLYATKSREHDKFDMLHSLRHILSDQDFYRDEQLMVCKKHVSSLISKWCSMLESWHQHQHDWSKILFLGLACVSWCIPLTLRFVDSLTYHYLLPCSNCVWQAFFACYELLVYIHIHTYIAFHSDDMEHLWDLSCLFLSSDFGHTSDLCMCAIIL